MADPTKEFDSARLKVQRAYRHIDELRGMFANFLKSDFCSLTVDQDPQTGQNSIYVASTASPPPEMALVIGDAVHNLRTALDHTIVKILGERGNRESFPVAKERDNPGAHSTYGVIKKTLPDLAALILEKIEIHDTGNPSIWAVSKIDNFDKHNLLIPVISIQELRGFSLKSEGGLLIENCSAGVEDGGRVNIMQMTGQFEITNKGHPAAQILFGDGQPLVGKPIIESLVKMAELTTQAINTLETFWVGQGTKGQAIK